MQGGLRWGWGVEWACLIRHRKEAEGAGAVGEKEGLGWESYNP